MRYTLCVARSESTKRKTPEVMGFLVGMPTTMAGFAADLVGNAGNLQLCAKRSQ
jgi:hypothetical protein